MTDGQTDTGRQRRTRLRIASRSKNCYSFWEKVQHYIAQGVNYSKIIKLYKQSFLLLFYEKRLFMVIRGHEIWFINES